MSREEPTPSALRRRGLLTLAAIAVLGWLASRVPTALGPATTRWTATIPAVEGVRGLDPGGEVRIGGHPVGRIVSVDGDRGLVDGRGTPLVAIDFDLPAEIVLGHDAVIRRNVGIAGTNGMLDIEDAGSRSDPFRDDEPHRIAIDLSPPPGGSMASVVGVRNGRTIETIAARGASFAPRLRGRVDGLRSGVDRLVADARTLLLRIEVGESRYRHRIGSFAGRFARVAEELLTLVPGVTALGDAASRIRVLVEDLILSRTPALEAIVAAAARMSEDASAARTRIDSIPPRIRLARRHLLSAIEDGEASLTRLRILAPEVSDGLARTMARMVLAGGQLSRATEDLLPLALEAISTEPDAESEERRRLLESVNDTILAGQDLRDAARRLRSLVDVAATLSAASSGDASSLDRSVADELETRVADLERTLDAWSRRLRTEIDADRDP